MASEQWYYVNCPFNGIWIKYSEKKEKYDCPTNCTKLKCCKKNVDRTFTPVEIVTNKNKIKYGTIIESISTRTVNAFDSTDLAQNDNNSKSNGTFTVKETANIYNSMFGVTNENSNQNLDELSNDDNLILKSKKNYEYFDIGGIKYNNADLTKNRVKQLLMEILRHWDINSVIQNYELKDNFIWLICKYKTILVKDLDCILNSPESPSKKFFHLFYDVFLKDEIDDFYYYDGSYSNDWLNPSFNKEKKFELFSKICDGNINFIEFYNKWKDEVLSFYNYKMKDSISAEDQLFNDCTLYCANKKEKIYLFNNISDFKYLGTIDEFINKMHICDFSTNKFNFSDVSDMIAFLQKYKIDKNKKVIVRKDEFVISTNSCSNPEDDSMYKILCIKGSNCATFYNYYVSLIREYVKVFSPLEIEIGSLHFNKDSYTIETKEYFVNLCEYIFSPDHHDKDEFEKVKGEAWLARSLFDRKILFGYSGIEKNSSFYCEDIEDKDFIELMSLFVNNKVKDNMKRYVDLFDNPKIMYEHHLCDSRTIIENIIENDDDVFLIYDKLKKFDFINLYLEKI